MATLTSIRMLRFDSHMVKAPKVRNMEVPMMHSWVEASRCSTSERIGTGKVIGGANRSEFPGFRLRRC